MDLLDVLSDQLAILPGNHSSSPGWKIASSFFDSISNAVVSATALFLRRRSRSSSWIRRRSSRGYCGLARTSSGCDNAVVAPIGWRQLDYP
jgi:hypothetical protein